MTPEQSFAKNALSAIMAVLIMTVLLVNIYPNLESNGVETSSDTKVEARENALRVIAGAKIVMSEGRIQGSNIIYDVRVGGEKCQLIMTAIKSILNHKSTQPRWVAEKIDCHNDEGEV